MTCRSAPQRNQSPKPRLAQEFQEETGHHTRTSSSLATSSLTDTWKLLDLGSSPSGLTSQDDLPQVGRYSVNPDTGHENWEFLSSFTLVPECPPGKACVSQAHIS